MDTTQALQAFASRVESEADIQSPGALIPQVMMRPVGAQAITVKRDPGKVLRELKTFAAAAGENWYYSWQVNNKRTGKKETIEGPSVKLANDLARLYGNCTVEVVRVDETGSHWTFYAHFVDFETGYEYTRPFQQRKSQTAGEKMDADRMRDIAFQIGASKAMRNCVVNALGTFSDFALSEAKSALVDRVAKRLDDYRDRAVTRLAEFGIPIARVERAHGKAAKDWDAATVAKLIAEIQAVNEGMTTAEELYPDPDTRPEGGLPSNSGPSKLESFAAGADAQPGTQNAPAANSVETGGKDTKDVEKPNKTRGQAKKAQATKGEVIQPHEAGNCAHCGTPAPDHAKNCPMLATRPLPTDAKGVAIDFDQQTGEAIEEGEIPQFLKRKTDAPATDPAKPFDDDAMMREVRAKYPAMSPLFFRGYVARARGDAKTDVPTELAPMAVRHWGAGWDARDMETEGNGEEGKAS